MDYYKAIRRGIIFVCESSDCQDDVYFSDHDEPHVFFDVNEDPEALPYVPACPVCGSSDNVYEHALAELRTVKVLNVVNDPP